MGGKFSVQLPFNIDVFFLSLDAEDPDLDALLADLCKLEEDTKAQLATSNSNQENMDESVVPPR